MGRWRTAWGGVAVAAWGLAGACQSDPFACDSDAHCKTDDGTGQCEVNGYCSFADDTCPSGRRYGELAGGGLAGFCVVDDSAGTGGSSTGPAITSGVLPTDSADDRGGTDTLRLESTGSLDTSAETVAGTDEGVSTSTTDADGAPSSTGADTDGDSTGPVSDPSLLIWLTFDPEAEGVVSDASGHGNHGQCDPGTCPMIVDNGPVGTAGEFDGIDDALLIAYDAALDPAQELTIAVWVRMDDVPLPTYASVFGKSYGPQSANSYELYYTTASEQMAFGMDAKTNGYVAEPMVYGQWVHFAGTWDGEILRLYVDGALMGTDQTDNPPAFEDVPVYVGADLHYGEANYFWPGAVDDLRLYDRRLTTEEVGELVALSGL